MDELFPLVDRINQRKKAEWRMQVIIAHTKEPKKLLNELKTQEKHTGPIQLDTTGFEALKFAMSRNPRIMVK